MVSISTALPISTEFDHKKWMLYVHLFQFPFHHNCPISQHSSSIFLTIVPFLHNTSANSSSTSPQQLNWAKLVSEGFGETKNPLREIFQIWKIVSPETLVNIVFLHSASAIAFLLLVLKIYHEDRVGFEMYFSNRSNY